MAVKQTDGTSVLRRTGYGNFPVNTGDWTIFIQFKYINIPVGTAYILDMYKGAGPENIFLGSDPNTSNVSLDTINHAGTDQFTTPVTIVVGNWNWIAIIYNSTTHVFNLYLNGTLIGTITNDLSLSVWDTIDLLQGGGASPNVSVSYFRAWSNILLSSELTTEAASMIAVKTAGLIWDCPLQAGIDLTSHNNTLNQLQATGTVSTDTTDPLLSIVAGPPTNTTPATAMAITTESVIFQNTLTAGAATTVWHKATAIIDETWGYCPYGDITIYKPNVEVYEGLANALSGTTYLNIGNSSSSNLPVQFPVNAGQTYYFKNIRNGAVTPATLQVSLLKALDLVVPIGSIFITDDEPGYSSAYLDLKTGYPIKFKVLTAHGEGGAILNSGKFVLSNDNITTNADLFDVKGNLIIEIGLSGYESVSSNLTNKFLIGTTSTNPAILRLVDENGNINPIIYNLGASGVQGIGLNNDSTKAYYTNGISAPQAIKVWDLINNIALSDLTAGIANYRQNIDIIILQNGIILVPRTKLVAPRDFKITSYNIAGTLQNEYDFPLQGHDANRLMTALDDPISFWAWIKDVVTNTGFSIFVNIKVSDGTILSTRTAVQFESGIYSGNPTSTPSRFGHSESCPGYITRVALTPANQRSGIYTLSGTGAGFSTNNPRLTHDVVYIDASIGTTENMAIPTPFGETFLAGDEK